MSFVSKELRNVVLTSLLQPGGIPTRERSEDVEAQSTFPIRILVRM